MKKLLLALILCIIPIICRGEGKLIEVCDSCLARFYEVQGYELCEKCRDKYEEEGKLSLHPSRFCSGWCAHDNSAEEFGTYYIYTPRGIVKKECPKKNKPSYIIKEKK